MHCLEVELSATKSFSRNQKSFAENILKNKEVGLWNRVLIGVADKRSFYFDLDVSLDMFLINFLKYKNKS